MSVVKAKAASAKQLLVRLHRGEDGMEAVQSIMMIAVAAMIMVGMMSVVGVNGSGQQSGGGLIEMVTGGLGKLLGGTLPGGGLGSLLGGLF